jgi:4-amino-4-deoxy-L-arabinose transferase-like glycosyltransferase
MLLLSWLGGLRRSTFVAALTVILALEGLASLLLTHEGRHNILGGVDGAIYERYARNLAYHGVFSSATTQPYSPSVFRTPGYPAFLALLHLVGGNSLLLVRAVQIGLIGVTALFIYLLAAAVASPLVARISALLCMTYLPLLWLARQHLTDVLATAVAAAIVLLAVRATQAGYGRSFARFAAIGALSAVAGLVRPELAGIVAVVGLGALVSPGRMDRRAAVSRVAVMLVVFLAALVPWTIRNYTLTHRVIPLGTASGTSLYASALQWDGSISMKFTIADWHRDIAATDAVIAPVLQKDHARHVSTADAEVDVNSALAAAARRGASRVGVPGVIERQPKRLAYLWSVGDEPPRGAYSFWHQVDRAQYALLVVLVLVGLFATWRNADRLRDAHRRVALWSLLGLAAYSSVLHLIFHVQARYTMPARPLLLIFAAIGLVWLIERRRSPDARSTAAFD